MKKKQEGQISYLVNVAHSNAVNKGRYDESRSFGDIISLIHSELSEALEDHRNGRGFTETWYEFKDVDGKTFESNLSEWQYAPGEWMPGKPCGIPSELADAVIRIFDACGHYGIDLEYAIRGKMAYNATRPNRHGGKVL